MYTVTEGQQAVITQFGDLVSVRTEAGLYSKMPFIQKVHPLETGILRRKVRRQRRSDLPIENPLLFYPRRLFEIVQTAGRWARLYLRFKSVYDRVAKDQNAKDYVDLSLTPMTDEEQLDLDIIQTFKDAIPNTHGAPTGL